MNSKSFLRVVVQRHIIINFLLLSFLQACIKIVPMSELTFKDCKAYLNNKPFSGKYELVRGDKYILGKVSKGILNDEKTFNKNILLMEKKYNSCDSGFQKVFDTKGDIISEGMFSSNKRVGNWKYYTKDSIYLIKY